jgi:serine acetyltransferase
MSGSRPRWSYRRCRFPRGCRDGALCRQRGNARGPGRESPTLLSVADSSYPLSRAWRELLADLDRYRVTDGRGLLPTLLLSPGSIASVAYRLSRWVWATPGPLARAARLPLTVINRLVEVWSGVSIPPRTQIGPGLYIGHFGQIIVNADAVLGANCNLSQGVTIGVAGRGADRGCPRIGNRVYIGPGAKLFGPITWHPGDGHQPDRQLRVHRLPRHGDRLRAGCGRPAGRLSRSGWSHPEGACPPVSRFPT